MLFIDDVATVSINGLCRDEFPMCRGCDKVAPSHLSFCSLDAFNDKPSSGDDRAAEGYHPFRWVHPTKAISIRWWYFPFTSRAQAKFTGGNHDTTGLRQCHMTHPQQGEMLFILVCEIPCLGWMFSGVVLHLRIPVQIIRDDFWHFLSNIRCGQLSCGQDQPEVEVLVPGSLIAWRLSGYSEFHFTLLSVVLYKFVGRFLERAQYDQDVPQELPMGTIGRLRMYQGSMDKLLCCKTGGWSCSHRSSWRVDRTHKQVDDQDPDARKFASSHSPSSTHHDTPADVNMSLTTKLAMGNASTVLDPLWSSGMGTHHSRMEAGKS